MAEISLDELYAVIGRLYTLHLVEQRDHTLTRQLLAEAQQAHEVPDETKPTPLPATSQRRHQGS